MRKYIVIILTILCSISSSAQRKFFDSLTEMLERSKGNDFSRVRALGEIADYYAFTDFDSCLIYSAKTIDLAKKINFPFGVYLGYYSRFHGMNCQGDYPKALEAALNMQRLSEQIKKDSPWVEASAYYYSGVLYREMEDYPNAISKFRENIELCKKIDNLGGQFAGLSQLGTIYLRIDKLDSAMQNAQKGYDLGLKAIRFKKFFALSIGVLGNVHTALGHFDTARALFHDAIQQSIRYDNAYFETLNYFYLANLYLKMHLKDSCLWYAGKSLQLSRMHHFTEFTLNASRILAAVYNNEKNADSTLRYTTIMLGAKDSIFSQARVRQFQQSAFNEIQRLLQLNAEKERYQNKIRTYLLSAALFFFLLLAFILFRNARQRQKAADRIEKAYQELKSTQAQLIQSEKMASLGELTAGIAHEIQNPLNFVNNFSEVNAELIDEAELAIETGRINEAKELLTNLRNNESKINQHGKRADGIVKSMLLHSRETKGQKEPTDINALANEYLRLSYQGLRAKDNAFNAALHTNLDPKIGTINIIPQDIGRVLLNLYNNAFYAVSEKLKHQPHDYEPTVSVSTTRIDGKVEIRVRDNGDGIPQKVFDKIFQPFFTTKPAGTGTGLGLSLSYDIVKAHGGEIKVETKEGEFTEFIIQMPISVTV